MSSLAEQAAAAGRTIVLLGNENPQHLHPGEDTRRRAEHLRQSVTRVEMRPDFDDPEHVELSLSTDNDRRLAMIGRTLGQEHRAYAVGVHELEDVVGVHAAGEKPSWVACSDRAFAEAISAHFGCPVLDHEPTMLLTTAGRDAHHAQLYGTSAPPAQFNYLAITANAAAPAAGDAALAGEIATPGGGLVRGQATYAHTAGTNTTTLTRTFTANGTDVLPVVVAKYGVLNAAAGGTMGYETLLGSTATLSAAGDNATVTETATAG